jgi:hypothetical protein
MRSILPMFALVLVTAIAQAGAVSAAPAATSAKPQPSSSAQPAGLPASVVHSSAATHATYADSALARMDSMRRHLSSMHSRRDTVEIGGIVAHWTAWTSGKAPRFIRETIDQEEFGVRTNEYFYEHGELRAFVSRGPRSLTDPRNPTAEPYVLRVVWGRSGDVSHADKVVADKPTPVEDNEKTGAKSRGLWLLQLVQAPAR